MYRKFSCATLKYQCDTSFNRSQRDEHNDVQSISRIVCGATWNPETYTRVELVTVFNSYQGTFPEISYTNILTRSVAIMLPVTSSELLDEQRARNAYIQD